MGYKGYESWPFKTENNAQTFLNICKTAVKKTLENDFFLPPKGSKVATKNCQNEESFDRQF